MEDWLKKSTQFVRDSVADINVYDYKNFIFIYYDYFSNRNLAKFISVLYDLDENDVYFEIDNIIAHKDYDIDEVSRIMEYLKNNGFDEWIELDD